MIRPRKTNTVILRAIPEHLHINDVCLFKKHPRLKKEIVKTKKESNGRWFVTFKTENAAFEAAMWVRENAGCKSSIKNECIKKDDGFNLPTPPKSGGEPFNQLPTSPQSTAIPGAFQTGVQQEFIPMAQQMQMAAAAAASATG